MNGAGVLAVATNQDQNGNQFLLLRPVIMRGELACGHRVSPRYGSETWTLLQEDLRKLEVFHMRSQRMILGIHWHDFVRNTEVVNWTNLPVFRISSPKDE